MKYVLLGQDLTELLDGYAKNPLVTENQRRLWPTDRRKPLSHGMLGKDHPQALRLLTEDGYDGQPVGSLSSRSAESFWYYTDNHVFPPEDDLIRLGIFLHLDVYQLLALVLKGKWEEFFAREICEWRANIGRNLADVLSQERKMEEALNRFNPDTSQLLLRILSHAQVDLSGKKPLFTESEASTQSVTVLVERALERMKRSGVRWLVDAGYTPESFDTLVQTMLLQKLHWVGTHSPELEHFKHKAVEEVVVWHLGTPEERYEYWKLRQIWVQLEMELDDTLLLVERTRLQNARIHYEYLRIFGGLETELREARMRCYELEQKVLLKKVYPELSAEELEREVAAKIQKLVDEITKLRDETEKALHLPAASETWGLWVSLWNLGRPLTEADRAEYIKRWKEVMRKIVFLIHPDVLRNNPVYEQLTPEQKTELQSILQKLLEIDPERELVYPGTYVEFEYRSVEALQRIYERVQTILQNAGINIDPRFEVKGDTLHERLEWLRQHVQWLEGLIAGARVQLHTFMNDEVTARERAVLQDKDHHEEIKAEFKKEIEKLKRRAEELEAELAELFRRG